jgi:RimJ/RimL family protein N-acetyltransferase
MTGIHLPPAEPEKDFGEIALLLSNQEYAYNLFTGVDLPYRGRQLGQAVKVLALRFARNNMGVKTVRTHHNTKNLPMIAINSKFGYGLPTGDFLMEKKLAKV